MADHMPGALKAQRLTTRSWNRVERKNCGFFRLWLSVGCSSSAYTWMLETSLLSLGDFSTPLLSVLDTFDIAITSTSETNMNRSENGHIVVFYVDTLTHEKKIQPTWIYS